MNTGKLQPVDRSGSVTELADSSGGRASGRAVWYENRDGSGSAGAVPSRGTQTVSSPRLLSPGHAYASARHDFAKLRDATGQIIGSLFFGTLLKTMRESALTGGFGHGGRGEQVFAAQLHGLYAEQVGRSLSVGPGETFYRSLQPQQQRLSAAKARESGVIQ